jgi:hypothetical protein
MTRHRSRSFKRYEIKPVFQKKRKILACRQEAVQSKNTGEAPPDFMAVHVISEIAIDNNGVDSI